MRIVRIVLLVLLNLLLLGLVDRMLVGDAGERRLRVADRAAYGPGDAPAPVRAAVLEQLRRFAEGYGRRDVARAGPFMDALFSREQVFVLGTMPREVRQGFEPAGALVADDWRSWGDCRFAVDDARVSSCGDVAWFATVGRVRFDLSRHLDVPLRLTGVLVREAGDWRIRQLQFQFDLDLSLALAVLLLLLAWLGVNVVLLLVAVVGTARRSAAARAG